MLKNMNLKTIIMNKQAQDKHHMNNSHIEIRIYWWSENVKTVHDKLQLNKSTMKVVVK